MQNSKTYVLLDSMDTTAPIYMTIGDKRVRTTKLPRWRPFLQTSFTDAEGTNKNIRFKLNCESIDLQEQILKFKIDANEKFTTAEREAIWFDDGVLVTNNKAVIRYLDAYPGKEGFEGYCDDVKFPLFKEYSEEADAMTENEQARVMIAASSKVVKMNVDQTHDKLVQIFGTHYKPSTDVIANQNTLLTYIQEADGIKGAEEVLREEVKQDEEVSILLNRLMAMGLLSFDAIEGQVSKKKSGKWIPIKAISADNLGQKTDLFIEYLTSEKGKTLLDDLNKDANPPIEPIKMPKEKEKATV